MDIVVRLDRRRRGFRGERKDSVGKFLAVERVLDCSQAARDLRCTNDGDMRVLDNAVRALVVVKRDAGEGEVAAPLRELLEGPAPRRRATAENGSP